MRGDHGDVGGQHHDGRSISDDGLTISSAVHRRCERCFGDERLRRSRCARGILDVNSARGPCICQMCLSVSIFIVSTLYSVRTLHWCFPLERLHSSKCLIRRSNRIPNAKQTTWGWPWGRVDLSTTVLTSFGSVVATVETNLLSGCEISLRLSMRLRTSEGAFCFLILFK